MGASEAAVAGSWLPRTGQACLGSENTCFRHGEVGGAPRSLLGPDTPPLVVFLRVTVTLRSRILYVPAVREPRPQTPLCAMCVPCKSGPEEMEVP